MSADPSVPAPDTVAVDAQNPWPGLEAFREEDQSYFHGRRAEIEELHRLVLRERLTVFFGVSGLGKTSLLQAGLFPILRNEHVLPVRIRLNYSEGMPDLCSQIKEAIATEAAAAGIEAPSLEGTLWESFQPRRHTAAGIRPVRRDFHAESRNEGTRARRRDAADRTDRPG
jgi:hypothetical protein